MQQLRRERLRTGLALAWASSVIFPSIAYTSETVVLRNGYRLRAERHEAAGSRIRLVTPSGGRILVRAEQILRIVPDAAAPSLAGDAPRPRRAPTGEDLLERLAAEAGLPSALVRAVVWAESGFRPDAVSRQGAVGLMQLMPATAAELGVDPRDPRENLRGGTRYLRQLLERYAEQEDQLVRALAAYNAGPGAVERHGGVPPYAETAAYIGRVVRHYLHLSLPTGAAGEGPAAQAK